MVDTILIVSAICLVVALIAIHEEHLAMEEYLELYDDSDNQW
jgi:hypothetical protein